MHFIWLHDFNNKSDSIAFFCENMIEFRTQSITFWSNLVIFCNLILLCHLYFLQMRIYSSSIEAIFFYLKKINTWKHKFWGPNKLVYFRAIPLSIFLQAWQKPWHLQFSLVSFCFLNLYFPQILKCSLRSKYSKHSIKVILMMSILWSVFVLKW